MANNRVYYPLHYIAIGPYCSASGVEVHGLQSVTMNTTFNLEQVFELGQLDIYENLENLPSIDLTAEKVIDGYPLMYHLASTQATNASLANRTNTRCDVILSVFSDSQESSSGIPVVQAYCSGMYINSITFNLPVEGQLTENINLVGNDKIWVTGSGTVWYDKVGYAFDGHFDATDSPASGVKRRQNVKMGDSASNGSVWPTNLPGITIVNGSGYNVEVAGQFGAHIQDVSVTCNLGRTDLFELGRRRPYHRYANFPTAVDCTINITAGGENPGDNINADSDVDNLTDEPIVIKIDDGTVIDLGTKNKLQSVSYSGGDTSGGVVTLQYQYQNFNKLTVTAPHDPASLTP